MRFNFWQKLVAKAVLWAMFGPDRTGERTVDLAISKSIKVLRQFKLHEQKEIVRGLLNYVYPGTHIHANPKARTYQSTMTINTRGKVVE